MVLRGDVKKLWIGAGCLFVAGFAGKQLLWQKISEEVKLS